MKYTLMDIALRYRDYCAANEKHRIARRACKHFMECEGNVTVDDLANCEEFKPLRAAVVSLAYERHKARARLWNALRSLSTSLSDVDQQIATLERNATAPGAQEDEGNE